MLPAVVVSYSLSAIQLSGGSGSESGLPLLEGDVLNERWVHTSPLISEIFVLGSS